MAAAASTSQQDIATDDDFVDINWIHFDNLKPKPRVIEIPRSLFNSFAQQCWDFFAAELKEEYEFEAIKSTIEFWMPKEPLSVHTVVQPVPPWTEVIDEQNFRDSFKRIANSACLSEVLEELDNEEIIHLIVTADGRYQNAVREEGRGITELPEIQGYRMVLSTPKIYDKLYSPQSLFPTVAPPVQIFHPIFRAFTRLVDDPSVQPNHQDFIHVQSLMHLLSAIDLNEYERNYKVQARLSEILQVNIDERPNNDSSSSDSAHILVVGGVRIPLFIGQFGREVGEGGCDPSVRAAMTMRRSWLQPDRAVIRDKCCCPTLMLAGGGAWMGVLGGVFTDRFIVQKLTDMMWVGHSSTEEDSRVYRFTRMLVALRQCIGELSSFYRGLGNVEGFSFTSGLTHPRFYPYPTSFTEKGNIVRFEYVRMLEDHPACVTYRAKIPGAVVSPNIVVKFVAGYGGEVHEFLAKHGRAPKLRYCGPLPIDDSLQSGESLPDSRAGLVSHANLPGLSPGPIQMIVMDHVVSERGELPWDARYQLEEILGLLHSHGYVLGDFRRQNVLFDVQGKAKIIDFDWAGRYEKMDRDGAGGPAPSEGGRQSFARYPVNISTSGSITWAVGVAGCAPIRPEHDIFMLKNMYLDT